MCIACDVGAADMAGSIRAITQPLEGKKVTMLVNNVGVAAEFPAGVCFWATFSTFRHFLC